MVNSLLEDENIAERGAMSKIGDLFSSLGRGAATMGNIGVGAFGWSGFSAAIPAGATFAMPIVGGITALGGAIKGVSSLAKGNTKKGIKEILVGLAEGALVGFAGLLAIAAAGPFGAGIMLAGTEIISKIVTGKTLTAQFGNAVAQTLDSFIGDDKPKAPQNIANQVQVAQVTAPALQPQVGMAQTPIMGAMPANASLVYNSVPAAVGYPTQMLAAAPPSTQWQDYVGGPRTATQEQIYSNKQQQATSRLSSEESKQWGDAVAAGAEMVQNGGLT